MLSAIGPGERSVPAMIGKPSGHVKPGATVRTSSAVVSCPILPAVVAAAGGTVVAMDTPNRRSRLPVGLPEPEEPDQPDDIVFDASFADDVVVDAIPALPLPPAAPPVPTRFVPPADRIRDSGAADWIGTGEAAPGIAPAAPLLRPRTNPTPAPAADPGDAPSALESVLGVPLPPMPGAPRKATPPRRAAVMLDIATRYEARLRLAGMTGDDLLRARLDTAPPDTLKAAVVRFGRGADPLLSPVQPISGPAASPEDE